MPARRGSLADHGTHTRFGQGCRCGDCRDAHNAYARERYAARAAAQGRDVQPRPGWGRQPEHGTRSRYVRYRCRCDACRRANNAASLERYNRLVRAARAAEGQPSPPVPLLRAALIEALCARMSRVPRQLLVKVVDDAFAVAERVLERAA
jgi:hypothetical protein